MGTNTLPILVPRGSPWQRLPGNTILVVVGLFITANFLARVGGEYHSLANKHEKITNSCIYPCKCKRNVAFCPEGVPVVTDGCGCCPICARQQGEPCNVVQLCDTRRQLQCVYSSPSSADYGICRAKKGMGCYVAGNTYKDGESFKLDCKTQCTCQNGTYGCVSLCPHENFRPSAKCRNAQLVQVPGACCREWQCESNVMKHIKVTCNRYSTNWTPCSIPCGIGSSRRLTNDNDDCELKNETRLCQLKPCNHAIGDVTSNRSSRSRRHHQHCRATVRNPDFIHLSDGHNCISLKRYRPKYCGYCSGKDCCTPKLSTTVEVPFQCYRDESTTDVMMKPVMFIIKCECRPHC
ncbi:connective tissue growth factor-like [Limulus polyphemus]|uniref:Connective tissue growth factor-like n=1 Tax=Limulus polyphemus TaxID=6850 RepID=A0ABM1T3K6_LIMPO|nr:connective tissue growth factor-like [Limulus polyphemus]